MFSVRKALTDFLVCTAFAPGPAGAFATCGRSLNSDWSSQDIPQKRDLRVDLRFDSLNRNALRTGTGFVDRRSIAFPTDREIQQETIDRHYTLTLDDAAHPDWGSA